MSKLKSLLPSLREKKRYLCFEVISKTKINGFTEVFRQIWLSLSAFLGELGMAKASILVLDDYNKNNQRGLIKVGHRYVNEVKSALSLIKTIEKQPVIVRTIGVSGIIRKAKKKYLL